MTDIEKLYEVEKSYIRINSKARCKQAITKLIQNGTYVSPEIEESIVTYMLDNPSADYPHLESKFEISRPQLKRLRSRHEFKPIKKKFVESFQNVLALEGKRKCPCCNQIKELTCWYKNNPSRCSDCEKLRSPEKLKRKQARDTSSLENFLSNKLKESKQRKLDHTITLKHLLDRYNIQKGLCFYSGRVMELSLKTESLNSMSLDRIDSTQGYIEGNVVLCCSIINFMKQNYNTSAFYEACEDIIKHQKHLQADPSHSPL